MINAKDKKFQLIKRILSQWPAWLSEEEKESTPKVKEGQEGSASLAVQPLEPQFQLIVGTIVTLFDEDVEMTEDTPFTSWIPYFPARYHSRGLQETVEGSASLTVQLAPRK